MNLVLRRGARRAHFSPSAWWRYLVLATIPIALAPLLLTSQWDQSGLTAGVGYSSALMCLLRYGTGRGVPVAWLWIGAGLFLNASGSLVEAVETQLFPTWSSPTIADAFYLALYPCVSVGLLLIVRSRYPGLGLAKALDAGTLTVGLGLLCWIFLIRPTADSASGPMAARIVSVAYPVGDLMLFAILGRVWAAEGWRTPTVRLLALGLLAFLLGDTAWAVVNDNGWNPTTLLNALLGEPFVVAYALIGAAALHPSTSDLDVPVRDGGEQMSRLLLASLTLASLVAPVILAEEALSGRVKDGVAIAVCSATLMIMVISRLRYLVRHVERQAARLRELALVDDLTGLPNRRALQTYLADALQRARRGGRPVSVALIDLDHFKRFNDDYGHLAGDQLLKSIAAAWMRQVRGTDMLARIGGEEFVLVLPDAGIDQADEVLAKLHDCSQLGQTFSAGIVEWDAEALPEELISLADAAMYEAKRAGRNRTVRARGVPGSARLGVRQRPRPRPA